MASNTLTLVNLKGNHEAMMWETCNNLAELDGGSKWRWPDAGILRPSLQQIQSAHRATSAPSVIAHLPLMHVDQQRIFVHAAVDPKISLDRQSEQTLLWKRYPEGFALGHGNATSCMDTTQIRRRRLSQKAGPTLMGWPGRRGRC